jgi:hypothetical protein
VCPQFKFKASDRAMLGQAELAQRNQHGVAHPNTASLHILLCSLHSSTNKLDPLVGFTIFLTTRLGSTSSPHPRRFAPAPRQSFPTAAPAPRLHHPAPCRARAVTQNPSTELRKAPRCRHVTELYRLNYASPL